MAQVKSIHAHIQPGTLIYRNEGEQFDLSGKLYEHVEKIKSGEEQPGPEEE